jgi:hypothetical protein
MDPTHRVSLRTNIIRVLSVPYWSRIWIVQEVMLPGEASILVGMKEINLMAFAYVLVGLITHPCDEDWLNRIEDAVENLHGFQLILSQYNTLGQGLSIHPKPHHWHPCWFATLRVDVLINSIASMDSYPLLKTVINSPSIMTSMSKPCSVPQ